MASETVIEVENVSKLYRLGVINSGTFTDDIKQWWHRKLGKSDPISEVSIEEQKQAESKFLWALKDINFNVKHGEVLGVIGKNGSGKSTLLKILSRITQPTTGEVRIRGRVGSLLEVGTGFHPDLTGRENIFMNGTILGMKKWEIKKKFDEIVAFSGVEKFIDTPVKRYSSGMYVRLAFSVAAHLEPEILIVDEVLAVGDVEFQNKCLEKIRDLSENDNRTILFVSHNMIAVKNLCDKVILLQDGKVKCNSNVEDALEIYLEKQSLATTNFNFNDMTKAHGNQYVKILSGSVANANDNSGLIYLSNSVRVSFCVVNNTQEEKISIGFDLSTDKGEVVFGTAEKFLCPINKPVTVTCTIPADFLNNNHYSVFLYLHTSNMVSLYHHREILNFEVKDNKKSDYHGKVHGLIRPKLHWEIMRASGQVN